MNSSWSGTFLTLPVLREHSPLVWVTVVTAAVLNALLTPASLDFRMWPALGTCSSYLSQREIQRQIIIKVKENFTCKNVRESVIKKEWLTNSRNQVAFKRENTQNLQGLPSAHDGVQSEKELTWLSYSERPCPIFRHHYRKKSGTKLFVLRSSS